MTQQQSVSERLKAVFQNLGALLLLALAFPFNFAIVSIAWLWSIFNRPQQKVSTNHKTIMIGGARMTKSLLLARCFHAAGHRVILVDTSKFWLSGNRFSNSVAAFYTVPDPKKDLEGYTKAMREIAKQENVDFFIAVAMFAVGYFDSNNKHVSTLR